MTEKMILIVEDNEDNSFLAEKVLKYYGFETYVIPHGEEALHYCETNIPDLILMDLSLPDIDGLEVTRQLRNKEQFKAIPIIAVTAHATPNIQEVADQSGMTDFLTKPFLPTDLVSIVRKYLS